jgi:phosphocarrier protein FPr
MQDNILFCPAPLIEGAITAGVQAGLGSDLQTAFTEAQGALLPKREQLGYQVEHQMPAAQELIPLDSETILETKLTLRNQYGLHARPAARFVQLAASFDAAIQVQNLSTGKGPVSAKSLNALATLGTVKEHQIAITASGPGAESALDALIKLVEGNFGEGAAEETAVPVPVTERADIEPGALTGIPIAEGIALGTLHQYRPLPPPVPNSKAEYPELEWRCLQDAVENVRRSIQKQRQQIAASVGEQQAGIFEAHELILLDPDLLEQTKTYIDVEQMNAAAAWLRSITQIVDQYRSLEDPYLQQRAADVIDVGNQVLFELAGEAAAAPVKFSHPVILVAEELTPTQTAQLDLEQVEGVVTLLGGPTSHSAILARSLGIPAITGVPVSVLRLPDETPIALDGASGALWIEPPEVTTTRLENERQRWLEGRQKLLESSHDPAVTRDGHHVEVVANVGNLQDAKVAAQNGAEGIGLLRTEFLFLTRETPPDEDEQYQAVVEIANEMGDQPVIVRTLDVGGDKALPYIDLPDEANPFLGVRAIRLSLRRPDLFSTQLRAILRAGENANLRIMFPMVAEKSEVTQARKILNDVHQTMENEGIAHSWPIETGIMIEVPSAAMLAPALAAEVDFFSIGTNDLTQYTLAAERGNPELTAFADGLHPAVLHLIRRVVKAAHEQGKWVGVCGELAGDPTAVPVLVGLGVDELSMNAAAIPQAKAIIRSLQLTDALLLASRLLNLTDAPTARQQADEFLNRLEFYAKPK